ncbi:MAG: transketolase family protein, partial [Clostridia bacterium]|nr:transketolase family protein [Clostridia bacterium]
ASHAGITVGEDGASHQCIEDISLMRGIPGMTVFCPADSAETQWAVKKALEIDGPVYIRLGRYAVEQVFTDCSNNEVGKGNVVADGTDIAIFATGITVAAAIKAREALAEKGVSAAVVDIHTIKPFDKELANYYASRCGVILTAEEHSVIGGLGSAVCEAVCETTPCKVIRLGVNDEFGTSASAGVLVSHFGLDAEGITAKALKALGK